MMVLITYDISFDYPGGKRRLRRISKACLDYGVRVQYSVFECELEPEQWVCLKAKLLEIYNEKTDSLRFYMLGKRWRNKVEHFGSKKTLDIFKDELII